MITFVLDIDSTIADNDHRGELLRSQCAHCQHISSSLHECPKCGHAVAVLQETWLQFVDPELMKLDKPIPKAQQAIKYFNNMGIPYIFLTGRNESFREVTTEWLHSHFEIPKNPTILMRALTDYKVPPSEYKERKFRSWIETLAGRSPNSQWGDDYWPFLVTRDVYGKYIFVDDDPFNLSMFQKYGPTLHAPECWNTFCPQFDLTKKEHPWAR